MKSWIADIICGLLIVLFTYTGLSKLIGRNQFEAILAELLLSKPLPGAISFILPVIELFVSGLLVLPSTRIAGLYAAFGLLTFFTFYIGYMILSASHLPCSCGGVVQSMSWREHLVFNLFFIFLTTFGIKISLLNKKTVAAKKPQASGSGER